MHIRLSISASELREDGLSYVAPGGRRWVGEHIAQQGTSPCRLADSLVHTPCWELACDGKRPAMRANGQGTQAAFTLFASVQKQRLGSLQAQAGGSNTCRNCLQRWFVLRGKVIPQVCRLNST